MAGSASPMVVAARQHLGGYDAYTVLGAGLLVLCVVLFLLGLLLRRQGARRLRPSGPFAELLAVGAALGLVTLLLQEVVVDEMCGGACF